jgi:hypothetical protein
MRWADLEAHTTEKKFPTEPPSQPPATSTASQSGRPTIFKSIAVATKSNEDNGVAAAVSTEDGDEDGKEDGDESSADEEDTPALIEAREHAVSDRICANTGIRFDVAELQDLLADHPKTSGGVALLKKSRKVTKAPKEKRTFDVTDLPTF